MRPPAPKPAPPRRSAITCRTASALRPKDGEKLCGDQCDAFDVGDSVYMALSDGMGSGEAAHREAAMTVRLAVFAGGHPAGAGAANAERRRHAPLPERSGLHHH